MGRINDALQRAQGEPIISPATIPNQKVFTAPWDVHASDVEAPSVPKIATVTVGTLLDEPHHAEFNGFNPEWTHRLVISQEANPTLVEQFRSLAATLHRMQVDGLPKVIMVTSADAGEGKTFTALNLSLTLSESYRHRVLLIDADLRRPSIREVSQTGNMPGLSECLKAPADKKLSVLALTPTLTLLPAGTPDPNPMSGLTSPRMRRIISEAAQGFDWVVMDAPPLGPVADAGLLASMVDGAVLVVRAGRTPHAAVEKAVEAIGRDRILGVVLNGVEEDGASPYGHYYGGEPNSGAAVPRLRE
jgi:capsular exopolysaccharide synthesis family protein